MPIPRPPPLKTVIVAMLAVYLIVRLLAFFYQHSIAILIAGIGLCLFLKYIKDITT